MATPFEQPEMKDLLIVDVPISLDVAANLAQCIGKMYPGAVWRTDTGHVLHFEVEADIMAREIDWDTVQTEYPLDEDLT